MIVAGLALAIRLACAQNPTRVVCVGDGLAIRLLNPLTESLGPKFIVQGASGGDPQDLLSVQGYKPDIVLLNFGTNVVFHDSAWVSKRDGWVPFIEKMIEKMRSSPSHPKVFLCLPPPVTVPDSDLRTAQLADEVMPLLKQAARETDCPVIDFDSALRNRLDLIDGTLPSKLATEILADAVVDAIFKGRKADWKVVYVDSEEADEGPAKNAIDGDPDTYWHTNYSTSSDKYPHEIQVDTGVVRQIGGFSYIPRQDGVNGRVAKYEFSVSLDGKNWGEPVATGQFPRGADQTKISLSKPVSGRYFRFRALSEQQGQIWASVGELDILKFYPKRP